LFDSELQLVQVTRNVYSSVVQLYAALGGGWQPAAPAAAAPVSSAAAPATGVQPSDAAEPAPRAAAAAQQDTVEVGRDGADTVVNVHYGRGIGGTLMRAPASGWPATMRVRLHGFRELESFTAHAGNTALVCGLVRPEGQPAGHRCRLDGREIDALRKTSNLYEVTLPRALLGRADVPVEVRWVDYWR
jgi:hypothetical protein